MLEAELSAFSSLMACRSGEEGGDAITGGIETVPNKTGDTKLSMEPS